MPDYQTVKVYSVMMSTNGVQWNHLASLLTQWDAEKVVENLRTLAIASPEDPQFEIKPGYDVMTPERIAHFKRLGVTVEIYKSDLKRADHHHGKIKS